MIGILPQSLHMARSSSRQRICGPNIPKKDCMVFEAEAHKSSSSFMEIYMPPFPFLRSPVTIACPFAPIVALVYFPWSFVCRFIPQS